MVTCTAAVFFNILSTATYLGPHAVLDAKGFHGDIAWTHSS